MSTEPSLDRPARRPEPRPPGLGVIAVLCVLGCSAPVLVGLASGGALGAVGAPIWLVALGAAVVAGLVTMVVRRRGGGRGGAC